MPTLLSTLRILYVPCTSIKLRVYQRYNLYCEYQTYEIKIKDIHGEITMRIAWLVLSCFLQIA